MARARRSARGGASPGTGRTALPGQAVLVLQGGGALGAFQAGVYQAMHEAGIEPDWVIGTSIGAIDGALIAGNAPANRLGRLREFWDQVEKPSGFVPGLAAQVENFFANLATLARGVPTSFAPNVAAWAGPHAPLGHRVGVLVLDRPALRDAHRSHRPRSAQRLRAALHGRRGRVRGKDALADGKPRDAPASDLAAPSPLPGDVPADGSLRRAKSAKLPSCT